MAEREVALEDSVYSSQLLVPAEAFPPCELRMPNDKTPLPGMFSK